MPAWAYPDFNVRHFHEKLLYSDRGSHFFFTPKAGEPVDRNRPTQFGRAFQTIAVLQGVRHRLVGYA